jgi:hypothetical protein
MNKKQGNNGGGNAAIHDVFYQQITSHTDEAINVALGLVDEADKAAQKMVAECETLLAAVRQGTEQIRSELRESMRRFCPSTNPASFSPRCNAVSKCGSASGALVLSTPISGIAGCCARARLTLAASNRPAPPTSAMNSRRFMSSMGTSSPMPLAPVRSVYRTVSLPRIGGYVLGADLNCSESGEGSHP